jgi:hypothetical protein
MPTIDPTHAVFPTAKDAADYQAKKDLAAKRPKLVGQPGGDDPTGRRALYPSQTTEVTGEIPVAASDGTVFAVTLNPAIDPGAKAVKGVLTDAKWTAKAVDAKVATK